MRILLLTTHLNIGGVAVYTVNLAKGLKKRGIPVYVASSGGALVKALEEDGVFHLQLDLKTKFEFHPKLIFTFFKLLKFIKKNRIDLLHTQTRVAQVLAQLLSKITGVSFVSTCHGFFKTARLARRLFSAWGDCVIAISEAVKDHLITDFTVGEERVFLVYNGVDIDKFSTAIPEAERHLLKENLGFREDPVIGCISRLSPVKGLRYLLFAMKDILKDLPRTKLLLLGDGPSKKELVELVKRLDIGENVFFASSTTDTERPLSIMDVFVFYSLEEGLGLSLLEALASGKPCVASNVGGVSSIIDDGVTGILVPARDSHALKEAIVRVLKDKEFSLRLAQNGRELVRKKFSMERMLNGIIDVYKKANQK